MYTEFDDEEFESIECTVCNGNVTLLGILGNKSWFRCINCGYEFDKDYQPNQPINQERMTQDD